MDSIKFLQEIFDGKPGFVQIIAITPDGKILDGACAGTDELKKLAPYIEQHNGLANLYYSVNTLRVHKTKKAAKGDIGYALALHVDVDVAKPTETQTPEWWDAQRDAVLATFADVDATAIIDSGGGAQLLWLLDTPIEIPVDGSAGRIIAQIESANRQLAEKFGGDNCWNIDRIMRLPGTENVLSEKKRKLGREPRPARVVQMTDAVFPFPQMREAVTTPAVNGDAVRLLDELPLKDEIRALMLATSFDGDRSNALFRCELALAAVGVREPSLLLALPGFIGDKAREKGADWLAQDYQRAIEVVTPNYVREYNGDHFVATHGGKTSVVRETPSGIPEFIAVDAFSRSETRLVLSAFGQKASAAGAWLSHPWRRTFSGIELDPTQGPITREGRYNLWRGFGVQPSDNGSCELLKAHMLSKLCGGDPALFTYLWNWLAYGIQYPERHAEVAVVFRGPRGAGKGLVGRAYGRLWGSHFHQIGHTAYLTGNFNAHLATTLCLFADEAFWAGDKRSESVLKVLITEPELSIEAKFKDLVRCRNRLKILMASNNDWTVPAGELERRFLVLDAARGDHVQNPEYFSPIYQELDHGGHARLLHDLLDTDLSSFDIRDVPKTDALKLQQTLSMDAVTAYWFQCLKLGRYSDDCQFTEWGRVPKGFIYFWFCEKFPQGGRRFDQRQFGIRLGELVRFNTVGKGSWFLPDKGDRGDTRYSDCYAFPTLDECRNQFRDYMGWADYKWPSPLAPDTGTKGGDGRDENGDPVF